MNILFIHWTVKNENKIRNKLTLYHDLRFFVDDEELEDFSCNDLLFVNGVVVVVFNFEDFFFFSKDVL